MIVHHSKPPFTPIRHSSSFFLFSRPLTTIDSKTASAWARARVAAGERRLSEARRRTRRQYILSSSVYVVTLICPGARTLLRPPPPLPLPLAGVEERGEEVEAEDEEEDDDDDDKEGEVAEPRGERGEVAPAGGSPGGSPSRSMVRKHSSAEFHCLERQRRWKRSSRDSTGIGSLNRTPGRSTARRTFQASGMEVAASAPLPPRVPPPRGFLVLCFAEGPFTVPPFAALGDAAAAPFPSRPRPPPPP